MSAYIFTDYDGISYSYSIINNSSAVSLARKKEYENIAAHFRKVIGLPKVCSLNFCNMFRLSHGY